jgi:PAS domain S-box-containing protein
MDDGSATRHAQPRRGGSAAVTPAERPETLLRDDVERTAQLGSWQWWPGQDRPRWSRNMYMLLGLDPEGPPVGFEQGHALLVGDSWQRLRQALQAAVEACGPFELEVEFLRADRSTGWAVLRGQALPDAEGRTDTVIGTFQDISERKRIDTALRTSEARMRALFESAGDALIVTDTSMKIVMANPAAARMHRCTVEQLVGTVFHAWIPQRHHRMFAKELVSRGYEGLASLHRGSNEGLTALRADGQEFPIEITLSQMHVDGQRFYAAAGRDTAAERVCRAMSSVVIFIAASGCCSSSCRSRAMRRRSASSTLCVRAISLRRSLRDCCSACWICIGSVRSRPAAA